MAEALAVVAIVASIIQLVHFSSRILKCLEDYQSKLGDIPRAFRQVKIELPVLLDALQQVKAVVDAGHMQEESNKALLPAVKECSGLIKSLDGVIAKALLTTDESWTKKALGSILYEAKVGKITAAIRGYIPTLTYHAVSSSLKVLADRTRPQLAPPSTLPFPSEMYNLDRESTEEDLERERDHIKMIGVARGGSARGGDACGYNACGGNARGGNARCDNTRGGDAHGGDACSDELSE